MKALAWGADANLLRSDMFNVWARLVAAVSGTVWVVCMAFAYVIGRRGAVEAWFNPLVLTPGLILLLIGANTHGRAIMRGAQVLGTLRAPYGLWRQWLWASTWGLTRIWLLLIAALGLYWAGEAGGWIYWLNVAATTSVCMSLVAVLTLQTDKVATGRARNLWFVLLAFLVGFPALTRLSQSAAPLELPMPVLALGVLAWPATAVWLWHAWQDHMPRRSDVPGTRMGVLTWGDWLDQGLRRFVPLHVFLVTADYPPPQRTGLSGYFGPALLFMVVYDLMGAAPLWFWGEPVRLGSLPIVFLWALIPTSLLVCRDMHWRTLLLPNHGRKALALRVFWSTLLLTSLCVTFVHVVDALLIQQFFPGDRSVTVEAFLLDLLVDESLLAVMVALATLLLCAQRPGRVLAVLIVLGVTTKAAMLALYGWDSGPQVMTVDAVFVAGLWVLAAIVLWIANRLLTPQRLLRAATPY